MGLLDLKMEPHKTILSILFILSIFLISKVFVWIFDTIDGNEDGMINIGSCPNIPVLDRFVDYTLNLINLDCNIEGGLTYEEVLALIGENYTVEDALNNRIFRVQVPFMDYFKENPNEINQKLLGLKADEIYVVSENEEIYSVYNDITYYVKTGFLNLLKKTHPIYDIYFVKNNETGSIELLVYDREGWSETIKEAVDLSGLDPTDIIAFKIDPKSDDSDYNTYTIKHPFVSSLLYRFFYDIDTNKILNENLTYKIYNAETFDVADPTLINYSLGVAKNKKLSHSLILDENIVAGYLTEILGIEKLNFFYRKNFNKDTILEKSKENLDYLYFILELEDSNTGKDIYPSYLEGRIVVIISLSNASGSRVIITSNQRIDMGTFYPFYNGLYDGVSFYVPLPLRKTKEFIYETLSNYFNENIYEGYIVEEVILSFDLYIYPYISTLSNKAVHLTYRFEQYSQDPQFVLTYNSSNYFTPSKEDFLQIIEGKEKIYRKVRKYAVCDYLSNNIELSMVFPVSFASSSVCGTLKKITGTDMAEYFLEAINYYVDADTRIYRII